MDGCTSCSIWMTLPRGGAPPKFERSHLRSVATPSLLLCPTCRPHYFCVTERSTFWVTVFQSSGSTCLLSRCVCTHHPLSSHLKFFFGPSKKKKRALQELVQPRGSIKLHCKFTRCTPLGSNSCTPSMTKTLRGGNTEKKTPGFPRFSRLNLGRKRSRASQFYQADHYRMWRASVRFSRTVEEDFTNTTLQRANRSLNMPSTHHLMQHRL